MWNEKCWEARKEEGFFEEGVRRKEEGEMYRFEEGFFVECGRWKVE